MTRADVADIAEILQATGRTVPAMKWVDELADAAIAAESDRALALLLG